MTYQNYHPEPFTDFSNPQQATDFRLALDKVRGEIGRRYPLVIGGQRIELDDVFPSINPSNPSEVLGYFANGGVEHVERALDAAWEAFESWQHTPAQETAELLQRVASAMRQRKHEFSAVMVLEIGKSWAEADADTAEAIDFLEYYALQWLDMADSSRRLADYPGERLTLRYIPLGVGAVIPPWNFANAILAGMTAATLVCGNTAILKPAEQSPWIGWKVAELFWEAGLPAGVLNFLTGPGEVVGAHMVSSPRTRFVAFTGSRAVGVQIYEQSAKVAPGQRWLKRAILEMGGKDAVLVDETADLDSAAAGIVASAFGFQGQKCSAGSRAIIVRDVYDRVVEQVVERARKWTVANTEQGPDINMGPVVDKEAMDKIMGYIAHGRQNHTLLLGGNIVETQTSGYFIEPTIFGDVPGDAKIAQEEIFGPVLVLIPAKDYDDALAIANSTEYGLTGSVYSRDVARLERASREFHVGNLYFNRKSTGAMVGIHPFGGFNMSGTDSKAGGPDYLLLFSQAKSIAEKL
jgi:1-pyrroline-5-carboxylate dehydrogenase